MEGKTVPRKLCNKPITSYAAAYHQLSIDEQHKVDVCPECVDKFLKWQQGILVNLFPTRASKKILRK